MVDLHRMPLLGIAAPSKRMMTFSSVAVFPTKCAFRSHMHRFKKPAMCMRFYNPSGPTPEKPLNTPREAPPILPDFEIVSLCFLPDLELLKGQDPRYPTGP